MIKTVMACAVGLALTVSMDASYGATKFQLENCGPKTATFLIDYSGSMMESYNQDEEAKKDRDKKEDQARYNGKSLEEFSDQDKEFNKIKRIDYAKDILKKVSDIIPIETFKSGLYSVAPYTQINAFDNAKTEDYLAAVDRIKRNMEVLGRRTPLGIALEEHSQTLKEAGVDGVVFLLTNGEVNRGRNPIESLKKFYAEHPNSCLNIISFAESDLGKRQVAELAAVKPCSQVIEARELYKDEKALERYLESALWQACEKVLSVTGINFAFDKYNIDAKSERILNEALNFIKEQDPDEKIEINGWTDWCGSDAYNKVLSTNRAKAVRQWLIRHGVSVDRLTIKGNGKSFKFDNHTREGRYQNRRMDFRFFKSGITTDERQAKESEK